MIYLFLFSALVGLFLFGVMHHRHPKALTLSLFIGSLAAPMATTAQAQTVTGEELLRRAQNLPLPMDTRLQQSSLTDKPVVHIQSDLPKPSAAQSTVVKVGPGRNESVYIAQGQLNKIATPFGNPQAIGANLCQPGQSVVGCDASAQAVGQDIYVRPSGDKPFTIYITDGGKGQSMGLTLVPKSNYPAQSLVLEPETIVTGTDSRSMQANDYVARISDLVNQLAQGRVPQGYTSITLAPVLITAPGLEIRPMRKFTGASWDLFSYQVKSINAAPVDLKEESFYSEGIRAVSFYPASMLRQGDTTTLFIVSERKQPGETSGGAK